MKKLFFFIPGKVVGKERPKFSTRRGFAYTPEKTANYEALVKLAYRETYGSHMVQEGVPLKVEILAVFPIPMSESKKRAALMRAGTIRPCKKPDVDNIAKSICDALNHVAYKDDSQITELYITKRYENDNWQVGAYVTIYERG